MNMNPVINIAIFTGFLLLAGCTSKIAKPEKYSGFLGDYSKLKEMKTSSGAPELRWVDPNFNQENYDDIVYMPVIYYPEPKANTQVGQQALDNIRNYTNQQVKNAIAKHKPLVTTAGPRSLIFKSAITGVDLSKEGLQFYEVVPAALLVAGLENVTGHRTEDTHLYFEAELIDVQTNKPVLKLVRKGEGETIPNQSTPLTTQSVKILINKMASDIANFSPEGKYQ
ncbi:DUF3313 domain-containing protein [Dryocola clanedunensis]|uniref:DUF3313 domain-containing protein n=1 Tax=Cedecea sulfonylureivorans TaxID=3051154 RepID=UPI0019297A46|nr:DUF3313 domain-containing protein [Cedecea sulfonylureivorans]